MGRLFRYTGHTQSYIADGVTLVSDVDSVGVTDGPLNAFVKVSDSGLDFTVDTGEAMIEGALVATDEQNTVTLPDNEIVIIYLAIDPSVEGSIIIDHDQSGNVSGLPRTPLYEVETASGSVSTESDERILGETITLQNNRYETDDNTGAEVDRANNANLLGGNGPSFYAAVGQNENISGSWTFNNNVTVNGFLELFEEFTQLQITETDTNTRWITEVSSGNYNIFGANDAGHIRVQSGGDFQAVNGTLHSNRGTAAVSGSERYIWVSSGSPSDSQGQDGDIWIEH